MIYSFHPEALNEYQASANFYSQEASEATVVAFISVIEIGIVEILESPSRWRVIEEPGIRRYLCHRFPFVIYYRHENDRVVIYAIMHASRRPGYWKDRVR